MSRQPRGSVHGAVSVQNVPASPGDVPPPSPPPLFTQRIVTDIPRNSRHRAKPRAHPLFLWNSIFGFRLGAPQERPNGEVVTNWESRVGGPCCRQVPCGWRPPGPGSALTCVLHERLADYPRPSGAPAAFAAPGAGAGGPRTGLQQGSRVRVSVSSVGGAAVFPGIKINREDSYSMTNNVGLLIKKHKCDLAQNRPLVCRATKLDHGNE